MAPILILLRTLHVVEPFITANDVAFYAYRSGVSESYTVLQDSIVIFDIAETNLDNGYSTSSGSFTALTSGYYVFTLFFQTFGDTDSDLILTVNDEVLCAGDAVTNYDHASCSAVVELEAGDVVNVKAADGDAVLFTGDAGRSVGFSGFLYPAL